MFTRMEALSAISTFNRIERPEGSMVYFFKKLCKVSPPHSFIYCFPESSY